MPWLLAAGGANRHKNSLSGHHITMTVVRAEISRCIKRGSLHYLVVFFVSMELALCPILSKKSAR